MDVGIGLPNAVPGTSGAELIEFARRADVRGFSSLGTIDRVVYANYEPLIALAAAAAVTERIGLCTSVLLGPLRPNPTELAKQSLSLNELSGGRFTLGIGLGARDDDYEASGVPLSGRGKALSEAWSGSRRSGRTTGSVPRSRDRRGLWWGAASMPPTPVPRASATAGSPAERRPSSTPKWQRRRSPPGPRRAAGRAAPDGLAYYSLGENAEAEAESYLGDYYAFLGEEVAGYIVAGAAKDAETVKQRVAAFDEAGCGELIFFPSSSDPDQVDLLADAVGL